MGTRSLLIHLLPTFNDFVYILKCTCEKNRLVRVYFLIMSPIYTIFRAEFVYLKSETIRISILNTFMILKMSRQFFGLTICVIQIVLAPTPKICNIRFTIFFKKTNHHIFVHKGKQPIQQCKTYFLLCKILTLDEQGATSVGNAISLKIPHVLSDLTSFKFRIETKSHKYEEISQTFQINHADFKWVFFYYTLTPFFFIITIHNNA